MVLRLRHLIALVLPFAACGLQLLLWNNYINPYVWFMFFPATFFCAWLGELWIGLTGTVLSAALVAYVFMPPRFSFILQNRHSYASITMFLIMGGLYNLVFQRLRHAIQITEDALILTRRRSIEELTRSEAELRQAQRLAGVGSWASMDRGAEGSFWSEEMSRIMGHDPALPPPSYPESIKLFTPESQIRIAAARDLAATEGISYTIEAEAIRPDGQHRIVVLRGEPIRDDAGAILGVRGTVQDITERKQAEAEIARLNVDLERRVSERTAELTAANAELEGFAYAVSHDLRAPLRAMSGFASALTEDYGDLLHGAGRDFLAQIILASRKMNELIEGILTLSRITRGDLQRSCIDISAMAQHLIADLLRVEGARDVSCVIEPGLQVMGDPRMIEVVMTNLLTNAWKYTGKAPHPEIRVTGAEIDGVPGIAVSDNGAGFDMAHATQLFQPFKRLHRQDEFPGLGIGLATVYRIIRRHGGEIRAHARQGAGAQFSFTLPSEISEQYP